MEVHIWNGSNGGSEVVVNVPNNMGMWVEDLVEMLQKKGYQITNPAVYKLQAVEPRRLVHDGDKLYITCTPGIPQLNVNTQTVFELMLELLAKPEIREALRAALAPHEEDVNM